ncbi:MAG: hypothetical protein XD60_0148 [Acetothermia bacterium 64_32]|nr:MAG: hypothetical protein XD60_0148 [Acetothermia bacterium 64_32]HAF70794.1 hypothetical protein [Candidatus Acetothermia bacterium]
MKIKYGGEEIEVDLVDVVEAKEPWAEYKLSDGTKLKVRFVLGAVYRAKDKYTEGGDPVYITRSQNIVVAIVPDELRKEGQNGD